MVQKRLGAHVISNTVLILLLGIIVWTFLVRLHAPWLGLSCPIELAFHFNDYTYRAEDLLSLCLLIQSPGTALSHDGIRNGQPSSPWEGVGYVEEVSFLVESDIPLSACLPLVSVLESITLSNKLNFFPTVRHRCRLRWSSRKLCWTNLESYPWSALSAHQFPARSPGSISYLLSSLSWNISNSELNTKVDNLYKKSTLCTWSYYSEDPDLSRIW